MRHTKNNNLPAKVYRNQDVKSITLAVPEPGHRHLRTAINLKDQVVVLQEATVAALVRGYIAIKTHPATRGVHLKSTLVDNRKKGYAAWQLMESPEDEPEKIMSQLIDDITPE